MRVRSSRGCGHAARSADDGEDGDIARMRKRIEAQMGIGVPALQLLSGPNLGPGRYNVILDGSISAAATLGTESMFAPDLEACRALVSRPCRRRSARRERAWGPLARTGRRRSLRARGPRPLRVHAQARRGRAASESRSLLRNRAGLSRSSRKPRSTRRRSRSCAWRESHVRSCARGCAPDFGLRKVDCG